LIERERNKTQKSEISNLGFQISNKKMNWVMALEKEGWAVEGK
jgi:hypothetical protein